MKIKDSTLNERGIAHLGLIVLAVLVIGFGYFAYTRVNSANDDGVSTSTSASSDAEDDGSADLSGAESAADATETQANKQETENVVQ